MPIEAAVDFPSSCLPQLIHATPNDQYQYQFVDVVPWGEVLIPAVVPVPSGLVPDLSVYSYWQLPSKQVIQIRKFIHPTEIRGRSVECVVRNVCDETGQLGESDYTLTLAFIAQHARAVMKEIR